MADYRRRGIIASEEGQGGSCTLQAISITPTAAGGTTYPDSGYDGFSSVTLPAEANLISNNIRAGVSIFGVSGNIDTSGSFDVGAFLGRTLTTLDISIATIADYALYSYTGLTALTASSLTTVGNYTFYGCTGLTTVTAPSIATVGNYAFNGCSALTSISTSALTTIGNYTFYNCQNLATLDLTSVTSIGDNGLYNCRKAGDSQTITTPTVGAYGCYYLGYSTTNGFVYNPTNATLGNYAFQYAKIASITGSISSVGNYALANLGSAFTTFSGSINGAVATYGFDNNQYLYTVDWSTSDITSIGTYAFRYMGYNRTNYSTVRATYDFRNSSFATAEQYAFSYLRYADLYLPSTVTAVGAYAFGYSTYCYLYLSSATPPTLSVTTAFTSSSNYKILAPYNHVNAYRTATNWSTQSSYISGWAAASTFTAGDTLPSYNAEGYGLTWYSDVDHTTTVTTCPSGSPVLYCEVGTTQLKVVVTIDEGSDVAITLYNNTTSTQLDLTAGYALVDSGDSLSLTVTYTSGYTLQCTVDGTSVSSFPYTFSPTADLTIYANAYDPSALNPDFASATWLELKNAVTAGVATTYYAGNVGDTKTVTLTDSTTLTFRLVDTTGSLYQYSDESGYAGLVFDCTTVYSTSAWSSSNSNTGPLGSANPMGTSTLPAIEALLPSDVTNVIGEVQVVSATSGNDGTLVSSDMSVFIPAEKEIFGTRSYSRTEEAAALTWWEYYSANNSTSYRIKQYNGSNYAWWLRSPYSGNANRVCFVYPDGVANYTGAANTRGVSPCFCI